MQGPPPVEWRHPARGLCTPWEPGSQEAHARMTHSWAPLGPGRQGCCCGRQARWVTHGRRDLYSHRGGHRFKVDGPSNPEVCLWPRAEATSLHEGAGSCLSS